MRDHWWWRPGWTVGRRFYTWHLTFDGQGDVHRLAAQYRAALAPIEGVDPIPDEWLHLTMQGVGFVGEVDQADVTAIVGTARERLAAVPAFDVTLSKPVVDPEAILIPAQPDSPVRAVRDAIRASIGEVLPEVPETAEGFTPHVSVGYSNATGPKTPFEETIASADIEPARARITHADLIIIHRDNRMYEWEPVVKVPLGDQPA
ncbi:MULTISPECIES: 2'-5' RNA ligase family protein [unclassified Streptomyces]|uniref:2'-5' RNA ligase family protein n=1 Tax=unclassified Streptomyces TaxID=2593676 RepID=UPI00202405E8|nr:MULTISPECIES: 2'-5' RNA ligase family protein [unclassified Streptomyces]MCX4550626.1 2'-5' RNA ligase family protein [Streptomyces sp. NBC_01500]WSC22070.1 2'-5' RNA ligase family protein [Streptomyces sp. NBC_01766]